ncbi:putative protein TPRXL [Osmia bicornis bicornis]|uniref:putative protein TPRXL n=1 Tax=Osmia bicornis bicornis TaxID=1437191 RepID=UPI001EAF7CCF|nr:putative protein TPRXL [Osmia bicornis bicornis]
MRTVMRGFEVVGYDESFTAVTMVRHYRAENLRWATSLPPSPSSSHASLPISAGLSLSNAGSILSSLSFSSNDDKRSRRLSGTDSSNNNGNDVPDSSNRSGGKLCREGVQDTIPTFKLHDFSPLSSSSLSCIFASSENSAAASLSAQQELMKPDASPAEIGMLSAHACKKTLSTLQTSETPSVTNSAKQDSTARKQKCRLGPSKPGENARAPASTPTSSTSPAASVQQIWLSPQPSTTASLAPT